MCDWEGCTTGTIRPPNPNQRRGAKTSGFPHPLYIQVHRAGVPPGENLGARGITPMEHRPRQGIAIFSVRIEFWRSTGSGRLETPCSRCGDILTWSRSATICSECSANGWLKVTNPGYTQHEGRHEMFTAFKKRSSRGDSPIPSELARIVR
jgi:hypothetical protein